MASTINADNGVVSGSAGLKESADSSGILALQTNGTTAVTVDASQNVALTNALPVASGGTGSTTLTANNVLLGNGTSAFQVVAPSTSGNVLTSNGTTWSSSALAALGIGQTWSVVTGSRAIGTTYTNSTGKTIFIAVTGYVNTGAQTITLTVSGSTAFQYFTAVGVNARGPLFAPIPAGATYVVSGFNVLEYWSELR